MSIVAVLGPTASGKSSLALELARRHKGEIVSVDSMQVYRGMDIGTAKVTADERERVPHHLIDIVNPGDIYTVADFQRAGRAALDDIAARGRNVVVCGGSGLHFRALVDPLEFPPTDSSLRTDLETRDNSDLVAELLRVDPGAGEVVDLANPRRVMRAVEIYQLTGELPSRRVDSGAAEAVKDYRPLVEFAAVGIDPGPALPARVEARLEAMLDGGWIDEVHRIGNSLGVTAAAAVGYRELRDVVRGDSDLATARGLILQGTLSLAKRQRTFFRRDPRIRWLTWHDEPMRRLAAAEAALEEAGAWTS